LHLEPWSSQKPTKPIYVNTCVWHLCKVNTWKSFYLRFTPLFFFLSTLDAGNCCGRWGRRWRRGRAGRDLAVASRGHAWTWPWPAVASSRSAAAICGGGRAWPRQRGFPALRWLGNDARRRWRCMELGAQMVEGAEQRGWMGHGFAAAAMASSRS
jgi:hypothetical protein